eukprot:Lithocolla_globosa_v1_NODE_633_length_3549_cov_27.117916.p3 type:complete len:109 gc:universal NODE_633_length_3549_cov_27.117916:1867-2193(+)
MLTGKWPLKFEHTDVTSSCVLRSEVARCALLFATNISMTLFPKCPVNVNLAWPFNRPFRILSLKSLQYCNNRSPLMFVILSSDVRTLLSGFISSSSISESRSSTSTQS